MRQWQVILTIEATVYIETPDDWDDSTGIGELGVAAVYVDASQGDAIVEVKRIRVEDIVEVTKGEEQ